MAFTPIKNKAKNKVVEVVLGASKEQGGTRTSTITIGGETAMPFLQFEGEIPHKPVVAMGIWDMVPEGWSHCFEQYYGDVWNDVGAWAKKCVEEYGAEAISLRLISADPELNNSSAEECAASVKKVLDAVGVPLIVIGCGNAEKDNEIMPAVAEAGAGENLLLGMAEQDNYKTLTGACMVHKHNIIASSPVDINICKQLNILITEMNLETSRIVMDTTTAALGYGIEYGYSILERVRQGALNGDKMLSMPSIANIGFEVWKQKEANISEEEAPQWGKQEERGILWEAATAAAALQSGMDLLIMRHPEAVRLAKQNINELMQKVDY